MKYFSVFAIIFSVFIFSCKPNIKENYEINEINTIHLNEESIMIIDTVIDYIINLENNKNNEIVIYMNNLLYVNDYFGQSCGCFEEHLHINTYENMVINSKNKLSELNIDNNLITSFINNNIFKYLIYENTQFKSNIYFVDKPLEVSYYEMTISSIGFDNDKTEAIIHMSLNFPNGFGYGKYIYLIKENDYWSVNNYKYTWIGG